jgi:CDP-4-dehydro-6-deoxyglucose reductase
MGTFFVREDSDKPMVLLASGTGFVHAAVLADLPDLSGHQVYACGAPLMVESAKRDFAALCNLPDDEFYADAFTTEADINK